MPVLRAALVLVLGSLISVRAASAGTLECARTLAATTLQEARLEADAFAEDFRRSFGGLQIDKSAQTVSTVGATLVGSAMANETAAVVEGLQQLVHLRDSMDPSFREQVSIQLAVAMTQASVRMRRISVAYGKVVRMASTKDVQDSATSAMAFADEMSLQWGCQ